MDEPVLMTRRQCAKRAGISISTLAKVIEAKELRVCRIRSQIMIHHDDFDVWIDRCRGIERHGKPVRTYWSCRKCGRDIEDGSDEEDERCPSDGCLHFR